MRIIALLLIILSYSLLNSDDFDYLDDIIEEIVEEEGYEVVGGSSTTYEEVEVEGDPREFVIDYYANIKIRPIEESYNLLSERFQKMNGSLEIYKSHFDSFESITVKNIVVLEVTLDSQKVKVDATVDYVKSGQHYTESYILTLMYDRERRGWIFH